MSLEEGHLLGRYRVEAFLAQGGMGRIYRAVDTLLGRAVALKVLADAGRPGSPAIARLLREARAAAALSHPNICSVFDVGEIEGQPFIAMELVQGTSLRLLLADPATGLDQRLRWVHDLALALAAAHKARIVHRDIKPDNVMVARDGRVRLLDFGVAKWEDARVEPGDGLAGAGGFGTQEGQVIGTTGYMAPEQAEGGRVDGRTDQFAWGVVAYETISGRHPYSPYGGFGEPPLLSSVVPALPFGVAAVVAKALALEPSLRFASMDDIVAVMAPLVGAPPPLPPPERAVVSAGVLQGSTTGPHSSSMGDTGSSVWDTGSGAGDRGLSVGERAATAARVETTRVMRRRTAGRWTQVRSWRGARWLAGGALVIAGVGAAIGIRQALREAPAAPAGALELRISNVRRITFGDRCEEFPSFLPDGRGLVFDGDDGTGNYVVYRIDLAAGAVPRAIVRQDDPGWDMAPSVSPDGTRVAFVHRGKQYSGAMIADVDGKQPPRPLGVPSMYPRWSVDGRGVWSGKNSSVGLYDLATGAVLRTVNLPMGTRPVLILGRDDGVVVAQLSAGAADSPSGVAVFGPDGAMRLRVDEGTQPGIAWAPDGRHLIASRQTFAGQAELIAVPLDGSRIISLAATGIAARDGFDISPDGTKLAWSTCGQAPRVTEIDGAGGAVATLTKEEADVAGIAGIPGGRDALVVSTRTGRPQLWVMDLAGERAPRQLDIGERAPRDPVVSFDGARFAIAVAGEGIFVGSLRGDVALRQVTHEAGDVTPMFRRGGEALVFTRRGPDGTGLVMEVPVAGGAPVALLEPGTRGAAVSPVDDSLVYLAGPTSAPVAAGAHGEDARPLSPELSDPDYSDIRFSPDGARVLLLRANQELVEVDVARRAIVRSVKAAQGEALYSPFYGAAGPTVVRVRWQGSIYVADAAWSVR